MDLMKLMKQAQDMQAKMKSAQDDLEKIEVEGVAGGDLVKVRLSGKGNLKGVAIDPSLMLVSEKDILEDLLIAAHADARRKAEAASGEMMKALTAGLPLPPGFKLPF